MRLFRREMQTGMTRSTVFVLAAATLVVGTLLFGPHITIRGKGATMIRSVSSRAQTSTRRKATNDFAALPLSFEPNRGQADPSVRFLARGNGYALLLTRDEVVMTLDGEEERSSAGTFLERLSPKHRARFERTRYFRLSPRFKSFRKTESVRIALKGASPDAAMEALGRLPGTSNYFIGRNPRNWHTNIPTYAEVKYHEVYPGIDLVYYGNRQRPEFDFVLAPGANPRDIDLLIDAKGSVRVTADGSVQLAASHGTFELLRPRIYQTFAGKQHAIQGGFVLKARNQVGIELAKYYPGRAVTVDPTLSYSTYFGGNGMDEADDIAIDSSGDTYVAGTTTSPNFPTVNGYPVVPNGNTMAFISKLDPTGATLLYSTYLGGSGDQAVGAIAVDESGNAYIAGGTTSRDFPVINGFQTALAGTTSNAFVARINTTQTGSGSLVFSSYLGGAGNANNPSGDAAFGIATDGSGDAYVVGQTTSDLSVMPFPTTPSAYQSALSSQNGNAFLTVVNTNASGGASLLYSTYLGGDGAGIFGDYANAVAVNGSGDAFLTGQTSSDSLGAFPVTPASAYQTSLAGADGNIFVSEVDPSKSGSAGLIYSTYLGGSDSNPSDSGDEGNDIALDTAGHTYLSGDASSADFPTTGAAFQKANSSAGKAIVAELDTTLSGSASLIYSTFLGGSSGEVSNSIAVDSGGNAFVVGATYSVDFPTTAGAVQNTMLSSRYDGFFVEMNPGATALLYSTFVGGSCPQGDSAYGVALDAAGDSFVSGETCSSNFPVTAGAYQSSLQGAQNGFIAEFSTGAAPGLLLSPASGSNCPSGGNCSSSATVQAGQTAAYDLQLQPLNGLTGAVTVGCNDSLVGSSCAVSPGSSTLSANQVSTFRVTVTTSAGSAGIPLSMRTLDGLHNRRLLCVCFLCALALVLLALMPAVTRSRRQTFPAFILIFAALLVVGGCAATSVGSNTGAEARTPSGAVTVTATSSSGATSSVSLTLTVN